MVRCVEDQTVSLSLEPNIIPGTWKLKSWVIQIQGRASSPSATNWLTALLPDMTPKSHVSHLNFNWPQVRGSYMLLIRSTKCLNGCRTIQRGIYIDQTHAYTCFDLVCYKLISLIMRFHLKKTQMHLLCLERHHLRLVEVRHQLSHGTVEPLWLPALQEFWILPLTLYSVAFTTGSMGTYVWALSYKVHMYRITVCAIKSTSSHWAMNAVHIYTAFGETLQFCCLFSGLLHLMICSIPSLESWTCFICLSKPSADTQAENKFYWNACSNLGKKHGRN